MVCSFNHLHNNKIIVKSFTKYIYIYIITSFQCKDFFFLILSITIDSTSFWDKRDNGGIFYTQIRSTGSHACAKTLPIPDKFILITTSIGEPYEIFLAIWSKLDLQPAQQIIIELHEETMVIKNTYMNCRI